MKEVKVEKITYTTEYEAIDGTRFSDKLECIKYDNSAKAVLKEKLNRFTVKQISENDLYGIGSEEYDYVILKPTNQQDRDYILQYFSLVNTSSSYDANKKKLIEEINGEILVFGIGCSYDGYDTFYYYGTSDNIIAKIKENLK